MPTPVARARFMKLDTKFPLWLATAIRPAGGYGATIWAHSLAGVDTTPWPFGPASRIPSSSASATSSSFCDATRFARLAVAGRRQERRPHALGGTRSEDLRVGRGRRADEHEVDRPVGELGDVGHRAHAEHLLALQVGAEDPARVPAGEQVVERDEAELAGVRRRAGDQHAAR